jgi:hypothetical protein
LKGKIATITGINYGYRSIGLFYHVKEYGGAWFEKDFISLNNCKFKKLKEIL